MSVCLRGEGKEIVLVDSCKLRDQVGMIEEASDVLKVRRGLYVVLGKVDVSETSS